MKLIAPGISTSYIVYDGTVFTPGPDGTLDAPAKYVPALAGLGFRVASVLVSATGDGPTLTAAAAASCLPGSGQFTLPANFFTAIGKRVTISAQGRISCVVTTPGTARFDVRLGGTVVFDTGALNLNVVAKTNVPWWIEIPLTCRATGPGAAANLIGFAMYQSEAIVGAA